MLHRLTGAAISEQPGVSQCHVKVFHHNFGHVDESRDGVHRDGWAPREYACTYCKCAPTRSVSHDDAIAKYSTIKSLAAYLTDSTTSKSQGLI